MNITAAMESLDLPDLDPTAKHALLILCCRANRYSGSTIISRARLAADMGRHESTAWRALQRLCETGHVIVENRAGRANLVKLTCSTTLGGPVAPRAEPVSPALHVGIEGEKRRSDASPAILAADAIAACGYCDELGWLEEIATGRLYRCSHERAVTDLTVEHVLNNPRNTPMDDLSA